MAISLTVNGTTRLVEAEPDTPLLYEPTEADVRSALAGNLCRCGAHNRIVRAVMRVTQANAGI
jgi:nicotinate dehydrogenase subunit A